MFFFSTKGNKRATFNEVNFVLKLVTVILHKCKISCIYAHICVYICDKICNFCEVGFILTTKTDGNDLAAVVSNAVLNKDLMS